MNSQPPTSGMLLGHPTTGFWRVVCTYTQAEALGSRGKCALGTPCDTTQFQPIESKEVKSVGKLPFGGPPGKGQRYASNGKVFGHVRCPLRLRVGRGWPGLGI